VDPLFRSAAQGYGPGVIGIILSGGLDDGSSGLWTVKHQGGIAIVQDPRDASVPSMPQSALHHVNVDYCLPVAEMAPLLTQLVKSSAQEKGVPQVSDELAIEVRIAKGAEAIEAGVRELGDPSPYACPECHGVLLRIKEGARPRFRCHTGHSYSIESLVAEITESVEDSLWSAIRSIEESVMLLDEISTQLGSHGHSENADIFSRKAEEARKRAEQVRRALLSHETLDHGPLLQSASQE
jgi:two-component system chemotaxis response regulator CheB